MQPHNHLTSDIYPLSDFNRKSAEHLKRLKETGRPEVLTVNGKAAVVLVDPEIYDELTQAAELSRTLMQIARAKGEHEAGQSKPAAQVFDELKAELKDKYPDAHF